MKTILFFLLQLALLVCTIDIQANAASIKPPRTFALRGNQYHGAVHQMLQHRIRTKQQLPVVPSDDVITGYITQPLDHFDVTVNRTWSQRYFVNPVFWDGKGPVIFLVGWEGGQSPDYINGDFVIYEWAKRYNALMVDLEHRFYGESVPFNDTSIEMLQYLSSDQALADAAQFVPHINAKYNSTASKWILLGGSYSGNLAAWLRLKYPHLYVGSMAISGPVEAIVNYIGYNEDVQVALGPTCSAFVRAANDAITKLVSDPGAGWKQLVSDMNLCSLTSTLDAAVMIQSFADEIMGTVQYAGSDSIQDLCMQIMHQNKDPYTAIVQMFFPKSSQCYDVSYKDYVKTDFEAGDGRSWFWQTCSQFAYYQTGESDMQPFSHYLSLDFYLQQCMDVFGIDRMAVHANVAWTNTNYGGKQIYTSNTVFTNGGLDPWHPAGILSGPAGFNNQIAIIANGSHCTDIAPSSSSDSASLKAARAVQLAAMDSWLK